MSDKKHGRKATEFDFETVVEVLEDIEIGKTPKISAYYINKRFVEDGFVEISLIKAVANRQGRKKKVYSLTKKGIDYLDGAKDILAKKALKRVG